MEEFSKSLIIIHRTLMLATVAVLAFALSDDPVREYRDASAATQAIQMIKTTDLLLEVADRYTKRDIFSVPAVDASGSDPRALGSEYPCLKGKQLALSLTLAIVVVPDLSTASIRTILDHLAEGEALLLQASPQTLANVLRDLAFDCKSAIAKGLVAIRIGSKDVAIRSNAAVRREIRSLSSLELLKFTGALKATATAEERAFALMDAVAGTATLELEYKTGDNSRVENVVTSASIAAGARASVRNPFAVYFPQTTAADQELLNPLRRNLGLIGELNTSRAQEILKAKIDEKAKYPVVYGVEIRSSHAVWGIPLLLLSLVSFLLLHAHSYCRAHSHNTETLSWISNILLMRGIGPAAARILTLVVLPAVSCMLLIRRLGDSLTYESAFAYIVCIGLAALGILALCELRRIGGHSARQNALPSISAQSAA